MIHFCRWLTLLFCTVLCVSCEKETYHHPDTLVDFVLLHSDTGGQFAKLTTDSGVTYDINKFSGKTPLTPDSIYRMLCSYSLPESSSTFVGVYDYAFVISPHPQQESYFKNGVKTDPLHIQSVWRSGDYINMILLPMVKDKAHYYHFVDNGIYRTTNGKRNLRLTLYHDRNGDYEAFRRRTYFSIPLSSYADVLRSGDSITLHLQTYKGTVIRQFVY